MVPSSEKRGEERNSTRPSPTMGEEEGGEGEGEGEGSSLSLFLASLELVRRVDMG